MKERWKDIYGYEGIYKISTLGRVKTVEHFIVNSKGILYKIPERIRKENLTGNGYPFVDLWNHNSHEMKMIHRLVAEAFIPNPDPVKFPHINHKNGIKTDYSIPNLEWSNKSLNAIHAYATGLSKSIPAIERPTTDKKIYKFFNVKTKKRFAGLKSEFRNKYALNSGSVFRLVTGQTPSCKGWKMIS